MQPINNVSALQLRPHQIDHFNRILDVLTKFYFYVDGSEMGTGKTYVAAAIAITLKIPTIVVCPVAARKTWQDVFTTYGVSVYNLPETGGIITYETLRSTKGNQPKHGLLVRDNTGPSTEFYPTNLLVQIVQAGVLVIFDECQKVKNKSDQNKASKALIRQIYALGGKSRIALLSGSALDKEVQVINFLKMVGFISSRNLYSKINGQIRLEGLQELYNWSRQINDAATTTFLSTHATPTNREKATTHVFDLFISVIKPGLMSIMPRYKNDGIKDIKNGFYYLEPQEDFEYQMAINSLAESVRYNPETGTIIQNSGSMGAITNSLVRLQQAKMKAMVRVVSEELKKQPNTKIVLFADYYDVIDFLKQELASFCPLELSGRLSEKNRNNNIAKFQEGNSNYRVLVGNPVVGGLSVNLHDTTGNFPRMMYIMPNYRINELHQATGRIFRDGIIGTATIRFFYGLSASAIKENSILDALSRKGEVMSSVHKEQTEYGGLFPNQYESFFERDPATIQSGPLVNPFYNPQNMINSATNQMQSLIVNVSK